VGDDGFSPKKIIKYLRHNYLFDLGKQLNIWTFDLSSVLYICQEDTFSC